MYPAMPFSARALKKAIFFDVDIVVKNKSKCGLLWSYRQRVRVITLFLLLLHVERVSKSFLTGKSDAYK